MIHVQIQDRAADVTLSDPQRRNALGIAMFDALDGALEEIAGRDDVRVVLLHGAGPAFCAGFDLGAATADPALLPVLIERLSGTMRRLRRLPQVVVGAVHGAAIAGGCALVSACDIVVVSRGATLGYPVHRIGISPAVTIPTLQQMIPPGAARALLMGGELIDGVAAHARGLAARLSASDEQTLVDARAFCATIAGHGRHALRVTKEWVNELDGSLSDDIFDRPAADSAAKAGEPEASRMLADFWASRR